VGAGAPPLARLAELGVARVSFAGFLMNQLYGTLEAKLSEIAAGVPLIGAVARQQAKRRPER